MLVLFYVNASRQIGSGHVMRQIALAQHMQRAGITKLLFLSKECPELLQRKLRQLGFQIKLISDSDTVTEIATLGPGILCIDDYSVSEQEWQNIRHLDCLKIVFDDQQSSDPFFADIVVNSAPDIFSEHYRSRVEAKHYALGPAYTILRSEFLDCKLLPLDERQSLLLTLGGADPTGLTLPLAKTVIEKFKEAAVQIKVIIGGLNQGVEPYLVDLMADYPALSYEINTPFMASCMAQSGLAISAAGSTLGELASMGVPTVALVCFDNQMAALTSSLNGSWYQAFDLRQYPHLKDEKRAQELAHVADMAYDMWHNFQKRMSMSQQATLTVDGLGGQRLLALISSFF